MFLFRYYFMLIFILISIIILRYIFQQHKSVVCPTMSNSDPICTINQGKLKGQNEKDIDGTPFLGFVGIPYAKPPLGKLRFKAPQPPEKWDGIKDATKEANVCYSPQMLVTPEGITLEIMGSEDCLYLNIFTRELEPQELKPVMVFIHGGAFFSGSSERRFLGPEFLMTGDVVLVTLNYRLGPLGFLVVGDPKMGATGNTGLKDQVQALKWVQENIQKFGGDADNVTVFGHSAGAACVHYLILSPLTKGLFHKAIMQSGSALCPWALGLNNSSKFAQKFGYKGDKILEFLQEVPIEKFDLLDEIRGFNLCPSYKIKSALTVEPESSDAFLFKQPLELMTSGDYNHVPLMLGYTTMEGIIEAFSEDANFKDFVPYCLGYAKESEEYSVTNKKIVRFYFGKDTSDLDDKQALSELFSDVIFTYPIVKTAKIHAKTSQKPVYFYRVSIETDLNLYKTMRKATVEGVSHGDDLCYLFKNESTNLKLGTPEDLGVRRFVKMWTNFARSGKPIPEISGLLDAEWKAVGCSKLNFLDIGSSLVSGVDPDFERMRFWDEISDGNKL